MKLWESILNQLVGFQIKFLIFLRLPLLESLDQLDLLALGVQAIFLAQFLQG